MPAAIDSTTGGAAAAQVRRQRVGGVAHLLRLDREHDERGAGDRGGGRPREQRRCRESARRAAPRCSAPRLDDAEIAAGVPARDAGRR